MPYEVIESLQWKHAKTGATASVYGALPWTNDADRMNWNLVGCGWTVFNPKNGTVGIGREPWKTREEAEQWVAKHGQRPPSLSPGD